MRPAASIATLATCVLPALLALLSCLSAASAAERVILDTDLGDDVDDAGTLAVFHALADRGIITPLCVGVVNGNVHAVPLTDAINTFYGRPALPVGTIKVGAPINHDTFRMGEIAAQYPHDLTQASAPDVVGMYRSILAAQPDRSVTLVVVGQATNIANLLKSPADPAIPFTGAQLLRTKVKFYSSGGNGRDRLPHGECGWNYQNDLNAAKYELDHFPIEVPMSEGGGSGLSMYAGSCYQQAPASHIIRKCYEAYFSGVARDRNTWDQVRLMYAVPAWRGWWTKSPDGDITLDLTTKYITWTATPDRGRSYASVNDRPAVLAEMNALMMHQAGTTPPPPPPAAGTIRVNFQPATAQVPAGYLADTGAVFGSRGNGQTYGWLGTANPDARDRNVHTDQRYDTFNHMQKAGARTWELAVPNGRYQVRLAMGDPAYADQTNHVFIEAARQADPDGIDRFDEFVATVDVADGRLTIRPDVNLQAGAKIGFIEVTPVTVAPPPAWPLKVNFQPAASAVPAGYLADTGAVFAARGNGASYGWLGTANPDARDRGVDPDQRYDTFTHLQKTVARTWEAAVPNGTYQVRLVLGDAAYADQTSNVVVEGTRQADPDGVDRFDDYLVTVTVIDGRLTIAPDGNQLAGAKLCFIEIMPVPTGSG